MNKVATVLPHVARVLLGLIFFVFGLNGFLNFIPAPPMEGPGGAFAGALAATGYMFPLIKGTEVLVGLALLTNRFVPLALILLAPIALNIALFHFILMPGNYPMIGFIFAAGIYLAYCHRNAYRGVLSAKSQIAVGDERAASHSVARTA